MAATTIKLHHLGFAREGNYGLRSIAVDSVEDHLKACEHAFFLTNHPSGPEFDQEILENKNGCYSLSVGDVVEVEGSYYACAGCGFKQISDRDFRYFVFVWGSNLSAGKDVRGFWGDIADGRVTREALVEAAKAKQAA
jgi:hypothetical protein